MDNSSSQQPLNLAAVAAAAAAEVDIDSFIDPALTASSEFFPAHVDDQGDGAPTQDVIDAVIKASLDHAQAQAQAEAEAEAEAQAQADAQTHAETDIKGQDGTKARSSAKKKEINPDDPLGSEYNPFTNPVVHLAPFSKPDRNEHSPFPEYYLFTSRVQFEVWLTGETSWCHYVQRRSTTPDKRSAERLQARIRAHERALNEMPEEERAAAAPLKTRRRNRVSPVLEKVTFTCHHSGSYTSRHSSTLPKEKLRLNTKKSVKCACASRIVLTENQTGDCRVVYHWKHEGHDPYSDVDMEGGRLPKVIDTWLTGQIEAGKTLDDIRKALTMSEEDKNEYMSKVQADPSTLDPFLPPPLALASKIKYPDIYNRYRKLKGPVKENKVLKSGSKRTASGTVKRGSGTKSSGEDGASGISTTGLGQASGTQTPLDIKEPAGSENGVGHQSLEGTSNLPHLDEGIEVDALSNLATSHDGLGRILLDLPTAGLRDENGVEISLEEAMRRMANSVGVDVGPDADEQTLEGMGL